MFLTTSQVGNSNFTALGTKISAKPSEDSIEFAGFIIIIIILKENVWHSININTEKLIKNIPNIFLFSQLAFKHLQKLMKLSTERLSVETCETDFKK